MQYHWNGYRAGDPAQLDAVDTTRDDNDAVDVLIVGCGPAGLTLAAQMAAFPDINTRIVERKSGPLEVGQADGIACRSMEMFEAFGFADNVKKEAYWVNEVSFWRPAGDSDATLTRADRIQDVEDGLSEMPHTILNQARVHDFFLERMIKSPRRLIPDYGMTLTGVSRQGTGSHPVAAEFEHADGTTHTVRTRYLVGCDGARSTVRQSLTLELKGEAARQLWGVIDVLAVTDFPDIRLKCVIQSATSGSMLIIPREGGYMVRLYIELDDMRDGERVSDRQLTSDTLILKAQSILEPYTLEVREVIWWSAYEIGQRLCDVFDDASHRPADDQPRIFIAGDACHTHSPKAGQGMNVSMADGFNLGWKLAAVIRGQAQASLLRTYTQERQSTAQELIDFDKDMARLFSERTHNARDAAQFQRYFKKHGRYTAGVETRYAASLITADSDDQTLAAGYPIGKRFHSAPVIRLADAKPMELAHAFMADGRWRLVVFAAEHDDGHEDGPVARLCHYLCNHSNSPIRCYSAPEDDVDAWFDVRVVFQQNHRSLCLEDMPMLLKPPKGRYALVDHEKVFCAEQTPGRDIFDLRSIDRRRGALLLVRPDQYVAQILLPNAHNALSGFFSRFMLPKGKTAD